MGETPRPDEPETPDDETARLELPSLSLPGFGRRRRRKDPAPEPAPEPVSPVRDRPATVVPVVEPDPETQPEQVPVSYDEPEPEPGQRRAPRGRPTLPTPAGWVAALVTGLVVGLVGVALTYASLRGCELVRGTQTCGGPGVIVLVVILVLMVLLGGVVLAVLGLPESRSTSFLAVGVLAVVLLLSPTDRLYSAWMLLVVPVLGAAAYVLAHWVTTAFVEPRPEKGPEIDVR